MPVYWFYSLLFVDRGASLASVSLLLAVWSVTGLVAEVPAGALADHVGHRQVLALGALLEGAGFAVWLFVPTYSGHLTGFVLWGVGGAATSGALEALLYEGLRLPGHAESPRFAAALGRVRAAELVAQLPSAAVATALFAVGGHRVVLAVSALWCVMVGGLAVGFPRTGGGAGADDEPEHETDRETDRASDDAGYVATLVAGCREVARSGAVRSAVAAVALVGGIDAVDEFFPFIARDWGLPTGAVPVVLAAVALAGAVGSGLAGRGADLRSAALGAALVASAGLLATSPDLGPVAGLVAASTGYGLYRLVAVVAEARLHDRIRTGSRATVASIAALGTELTGLAVFGLWAVGGMTAIAVGMVAVAGFVTRSMRRSRVEE